jgi:hypothetical protein
MCKERDKPYGLLIRKLDFPFVGSSANQTLQSASAIPAVSAVVSPPILMYRIYPDGREELIRACVSRLSTRSLPDILAASETPYSTSSIMVRRWRTPASAATLPLPPSSRRGCCSTSSKWISCRILAKAGAGAAAGAVSGPLASVMRLLSRTILRELVTTALLWAVLFTFLIF